MQTSNAVNAWVCSAFGNVSLSYVQGLLCYLARLDVKKSGITLGQLLPRYLLPEISGRDFAMLKFTQDGSSIGLHQGGYFSLPAGLSRQGTSPQYQ